MDWYRGKKIFITGGSSGIGKATACLAAKWGGHVCIASRDAARCEGALKEIRGHAKGADQKVLSVSLDVSDRAQVNRVIPDAVKQLGGIDVLVNCAGITHPGYFKDIPDSAWDSIMAIDYMGTVNTVRAVLPFFVRQKSGNIANVSSACGYMGLFGYAAYCPAKFAVVGFSETIRQDLLAYNVKVSVVYPADVDTPQWHEENKIKPAETRALAGTIKVTQPEVIAAAMLKGVAKGTFAIVPGLMNKVTYFANRHLPGVVWAFLSSTLRGYWRKNPVKG